MKVSFAQDTVKESHGLQGQASFHIRQNAHAFKMLSSGLYSDKIRAVLREIGCNASDAHIAHGTPDLPIIVKLPTKLDNQFYIQDHGPGLAHDEVMGLYTTYFASTKQSSNEFTGAFGLGSKSPFSYTDSFVVTSVHGGKKRIYSAHLGNDGMPTIALMSETDCDADWQHGVRVGFPVKVEDFQWFAQKAQLVFQHFRVPPKILGGEPIEPPKVLAQQGDVARYESHAGTVVVMGNVAYPVDGSRLEDSTNRLASLLNAVSGIVIQMPIGSVQVAASREELQYDKESLKNLKEKLLEAFKAIAEDLVKKAHDASKSWEGRITSGVELVSAWITTGNYNTTNIRTVLELTNTPSKDLELVLSFVGKNISVPKPTTANRRRAHWDNYRKRVRFEEDQPYVWLKKIVVVHGPRTQCLVKIKHAYDMMAEADREHVDYIIFTPTLGTTETEVMAQAAAEDFAKHLNMVTPVSRLRDMAMPPTHIVAKKVRGKKVNPLSVPLPNVSRKAFSCEGTINSTLHERHKLYMCTFSGGGWGNSTGYVRPGVGTIESEPNRETSRFSADWVQLTELLKAVNLDYDIDVFMLPLAEIRSMGLIKRGWTNALAGGKAMLESDKLRDAVKAHVKAWRPTVPANGWLGRLREHIDKGRAGLPKDAERLAKAVKFDTKSIEMTPTVVTMYQQVCATFGAEVLTLKYPSALALEKELRDKYPATDLVSPKVLLRQDYPEFINIVFR